MIKIELFEENGRVIHRDISDIEQSAGGSVRCMLAAVHLPHNSDDMESEA